MVVQSHLGFYDVKKIITVCDIKNQCKIKVFYSFNFEFDNQHPIFSNSLFYRRFIGKLYIPPLFPKQYYFRAYHNDVIINETEERNWELP